MPWINGVAGLVQTWLSGNESGNALADVIFGKINPAGRLPLTLPAREEDIPAHLNFRGENGKVHYTEGVFVGYKHYQSRKVKPLYPFGYVQLPVIRRDDPDSLINIDLGSLILPSLCLI